MGAMGALGEAMGALEEATVIMTMVTISVMVVLEEGMVDMGMGMDIIDTIDVLITIKNKIIIDIQIVTIIFINFLHYFYVIDSQIFSVIYQPLINKSPSH